MKLNILNKEGNKVKEVETKLFEEPVRVDIISKVVEAEKIRQPYSSKFRAGMDRSASGNVSHRRHVWKSDRGRGLSRIPKKAFWRRGTQFSWEGAIVPSTRGGRRAHPPKVSVDLKKINKKELKKAFLSALSYVANVDSVVGKYDSVKKIDRQLPFVVENNIVQLKTNEFLECMKKIMGDLYNVGIQKKTIRAGIGKLRGRKYKKNAGLLFVIGKDEKLKVKGVEIVNVPDLSVSDLASNGARLVLFTEKAIEELAGLVGEKVEKVVSEKKKSNKIDRRKVRKENRKKMKGKVESKDIEVEENA